MSARLMRARLFQAEEWLEHIAQTVFGDPGSIVIDHDLQTFG